MLSQRQQQKQMQMQRVPLWQLVMLLMPDLILGLFHYPVDLLNILTRPKEEIKVREKQVSKYWAGRGVAIYFNSQYTFARLKF